MPFLPALIPSALGDRLLFIANNELWVSDGTEVGTYRLHEGTVYRTSQSDVALIEFRGEVYFSARVGTTGNSYGLMKTDGTIEGTTWVGPGSTGPPSGFAVMGDHLYFNFNQNLWKSDGTESGTQQLVSPSTPIRPENLTKVAIDDGNGPAVETLFFTAEDDLHGHELWKSDGTASGTVLVERHPSK